MKRMVGVAGLLALILAATFAAEAHAITCGASLRIKFDSNSWANETLASADYTNMLDPATAGVGAYASASGSVLSIVGTITGFCPPLDDLVPVAATKEYTLFITGLTASAATATVVFGPPSGAPLMPRGKKWDTDFTGGTFQIWEGIGATFNAPTAANITTNPYGGSTVPANFVDGTLILSGTVPNLHVTVTRNNATTNAVFGGNANGKWQSTGGSRYTDMVNANIIGIEDLNLGWCGRIHPSSACTPPTYTANPNGEFKGPEPTASQKSTWGSIKLLYH